MIFSSFFFKFFKNVMNSKNEKLNEIKNYEYKMQRKILLQKY